MSMSLSDTDNPAKTALSSPEPEKTGADSPALVFPTETEIYITPDGHIVFADLPAELEDAASALGTLLPCEIVQESAHGN